PLMFLCSIFLGFGQRDITGTVLDASQVPLPGVSIVVMGTSVGTTTDFDGHYTIGAEAGQTLVFSYIGFSTKEVPVGTSNTLDVTMEEDVQSLGEVVVVGFGTQRKVNLSGAVNTVSVEELDTRPINNITQGLQGISPGLNIDFNSGAPGADPVVNIRGFTSINGGDPLIILDGVGSGEHKS